MKNAYKILTAFALGAAAGAVLGVLFAPEKGTETRALITEKGRKAVHEAKELMDKGKEKFSHLRDEGAPRKREIAEHMS